jgi:tetratricopeptide (TPR) repeat protein
VFSAWNGANPGEGCLSLRLRSPLLAALLGLLVPFCLGQDPVPPSAPQPNQSSPNQSSPSQPAQNQPPQNPTPQSENAPKVAPSQEQPTAPDAGQSSSKEQVPASQAPEKMAPPKQPLQKQPLESQVPRNQSLITLDSSETIFAVLTALNTCGYDQDLSISDPTRSNVRAEVQKNIQNSPGAEAARSALCEFAQNHISSTDQNRNLSQFISLALYMDGPPHFAPRVKEDDLPPDAVLIAGFGTLLEPFYERAGLHSIWERHRYEYAAAMRCYREPLAEMVFDTEIYLKQPSSQYLGRRFTIYLDFMGSPNETDARNYGPDYYVVVSPAPDKGASEAALKMEQIRHTFLHYELDPLAEKHFASLKRLEPLLQAVKRAPLEDNFKTDITLLVTECLVRAIEIRTTGGKQPAEEAMRAQAVDDAVKQGYILTRYFYNAVVGFEKDPVGIRESYGDFVGNVDVRKEERAAAEVQFASATSPELLRFSRPEERRILVTAEKRLAAGDPKGAQELAQQALDKKIGDQGRALFILAEVAVANKNRDGAQDGFQKAIVASQDPTVLGWSHVYLGRILDMKEEREAALQEYKSALDAGGKLPEIKAAAERGLAQPYEPPAKPQPQ